MAGHDIFNDVTPKQTLTPQRLPSISQYKTAILASPVAASYPAAQLQRATLNDLRAIAARHSIVVPTT